MKVFLSGEGPDDLGDMCRPLHYRSDPRIRGVIESMLRKFATVEFEVIGARVWKQIRKFRSGQRIQPETRNVLGLLLEADEAGADVLVFVRDQDGDEDRQADIDEGLRRARESGGPSVVGGVAIQEIEAWILALRGEYRSETLTDPKTVLAEKHGISNAAGKVAAVEDGSLQKIPRDAQSLLRWLREVEARFAPNLTE